MAGPSGEDVLSGSVCMALLRCRGHPNVQLEHATTFELASEERLTPRGDCVACVSCRGVGEAAECAARRGLAVLYILALNPWEGFEAASVYGLSPGSKPSRLVVRIAGYERDSLMVYASAPARGLPRRLRDLLQSPLTRCLALYAVLEVDEELQQLLNPRRRAQEETRRSDASSASSMEV